MEKIGDTYVMDREDLIRINRLVRGNFDVLGYRDWYDAVSKDEQIALMFALYTFSVQTGLHIQLLDKAVKNSGTSLKLAELIQDLVAGGTLGKLRIWLGSASDDDRRDALPLFVQLFGESEAAVMALETEETCNHWWHRDLLDPKVIADLMSNPNWSATSRKDDHKLR
jgi:hypothetical protein